MTYAKAVHISSCLKRNVQQSNTQIALANAVAKVMYSCNELYHVHHSDEQCFGNIAGLDICARNNSIILG